jgi:hypothetical protein
MSSPSPTPSESLEVVPTSAAHSALINSKLVIVESVAANKKNKKAATKKTVKNKQFTHKFDTSIENYVGFLNRFLKTHHRDKYQATADHTFTFKIQVPPAKYEHGMVSNLQAFADCSHLELGKPVILRTMKNTGCSLGICSRQSPGNQSVSLSSSHKFRSIVK